MTVADIIAFIERLAPPDLAERDDPTGFHVGDPAAQVTRIAVAVDACPETVDAASALGANLLVSHHPLIYYPLKRVVATDETGDAVLRAVRAGLSVYSAHTNWDAAPGGINDTLAERLGLTDTKLLATTSTEPFYKVVVFVPDEAMEAVRAAMCESGGHIGNYSDCSFRTRGAGTFKPLDGAKPYVGETGKLEQADEWRLETLSPARALPRVIEAMLAAHPYEEVAYDVYPLGNEPKKFGFGRVGVLEKPRTLADFRTLVETALCCPGFARVTGDPKRAIRTVAVCGGAGDSLLEDAARARADVYVTGDVRNHAMVSARWHGMAVIDAGHFETEKPGMEVLAQALSDEFSHDKIEVHYVDR